MVRMERLALAQQQQQQCEMELMKAAMLKHEETFRQQVHDLHRLYRVQKQLMSDLTRRPSTPRQQGQRRSTRQHPRRPELKYPQLLVDDEHTAGRDTSTGRQVTPPSTDELELTLALGGGGGSGSQRRRRESTPSSTTDGSLLQTPSSSTDSSGALHQRAAACDLRREGVVAMAKQQPQWLLRCLSLRMA